MMKKIKDHTNETFLLLMLNLNDNQKVHFQLLTPNTVIFFPL